MKYAIWAIALLWSVIAQAHAVPEITEVRIGTINGQVIESGSGIPVAYAAVVLKSVEDGSTISGGITREDGSFELKKLPEGTFVFEVQFIGYKKHSLQVIISKQKRKLELGVISLDEEAEKLKGVEVVAERTTIEQRIDRKVLNVVKDLTTTGATASDIMNNIPSVNIDQQTGQLTLRGNSNVRVMVDGKLSYVPVEQLLRQIPSTSIKQIELITNPSAKYNPEGMSGIINIVLHKNANIGFNGNINTGLTYGEEAKFNSSIDLNYRRGKFNIYGSYGNNIGKYVNNGFINRPDENSLQEFEFLNNNKSNLFKIGLDFFISDKHTLSIFTNQNYFDGQVNGTTEVTYADSEVGKTRRFSGKEGILTPKATVAEYYYHCDMSKYRGWVG